MNINLLFGAIISFASLSAFAALTPLPDSLNCNIAGDNLSCQTMPTGMMIAGNSYPPTAGVYNFKNYATLADGIIYASYGIDNNADAGFKLGNNRFANYMVDVSKTVAENPNWTLDNIMNEYKCTAAAADCGVELTHP